MEGLLFEKNITLKYSFKTMLAYKVYKRGHASPLMSWWTNNLNWLIYPVVKNCQIHAMYFMIDEKDDQT